MNILRFYAHGIREASRRPTMMALLWLANFGLAAPACLLFSGVLGAAAGRSAEPLDQSAIFEFLVGSAGALRGVVTTAAVAAVLSALLSIFLHGGILHTLVGGGTGERPGPSFFAGGARFYGRFLRLAVYSVVLWIPALALFISVHFLATGIMGDSTNERLGFALTVFRVVLAVFLTFFIRMILDYARIRIVREDTNRVYDALAGAVRFVFGRLGGTLLLYYLLGATGGAMLAVYLVLDRVLPGTSMGAIVSGFLLTQLFIAGRGWLKIAFQAAELKLSSGA